ncbi:hypothetical protein JMJ35_004755 [Cladonia borealis]|uniref:HhH-GPD domain-containing protein n=1 Tax=Cladonia borealis TaxID=184061 RepID=A0AA39R3M5_9LECA|nr:hypothetical protein JMJ35_004755 [Cladonia borealis]
MQRSSRLRANARTGSLGLARERRRVRQNDDGSNDERDETEGDSRLAEKKWLSWAPTATSSPFPSFPSPTPADCEETYHMLNHRHRATIEEEFKDPNTPETIPHMLDAIMGSVFAYEKIVAGGRQKLEDTIRCGGLHVRKSTFITSMLQQVHERHGNWDLDYLFDATDEQAMKELLNYKGMGPKCAFVVMSWCLKRNPFTVDTHVFRIAGLWGWIPEKTTREKTQAHLDATVPKKLKFDLHFLLIAHGRTCPACRGGSKSKESCEAREEVNARLRTREESSSG